MRITQLLTEDLLIPSLRASARNEALEEIVTHLAATSPTPLAKEQVLQALLERERLGSTAIGHGIAIPHAKLRTLNGVVACLARSQSGVEFESLDGAPTHLIFVLLGPVNNAGLHLKAVARTSRMFMDASLRQALMEASGRSELWRLLELQDHAEQSGT